MLKKSCLYLLLLLFSFGEGYGQDKHEVDPLKRVVYGISVAYATDNIDGIYPSFEVRKNKHVLQVGPRIGISSRRFTDNRVGYDLGLHLYYFYYPELRNNIMNIFFWNGVMAYKRNFIVYSRIESKYTYWYYHFGLGFDFDLQACPPLYLNGIMGLRTGYYDWGRKYLDTTNPRRVDRQGNGFDYGTIFKVAIRYEFSKSK